MNRQIFFPRISFPLVLSLSLVALSACARPPVKEMAGADVALSAAGAAGAEARAPEKYRLAKNLFSRSFLDVKVSDYERARQDAIKARKVALEAEETALRASKLVRLKNHKERRKEGQPETPPLARASVTPTTRRDEGGAKELARTTARPAERPRLAERHRVVKGESLWKISAYPQVYNDPLRWPLLYQANRERIADPDLIFPGQELKIPRDHGPQDVAEAVRVAKGRGVWSLWDRR